MSTTTATVIDANSIIHDGWNILVEQLGLQKATQFVILLERGKGDSVKEIAEYWGDKSIDEIYGHVEQWMTKRQSTSYQSKLSFID